MIFGCNFALLYSLQLYDSTMMGNLIPLQRDVSSRAFKTEWSHQLLAIEQSIDFYQEYFLWASQQISHHQEADGNTSPKFEAFFNEEMPNVTKEVREAIRTLRLLVRSNET